MKQWEYHSARDQGLPHKERVISLKRECGIWERVAHRIAWRLVRLYLRIAQHLRILGQERLPPRGPFVLIANHTSHFDALVLSTVMRKTTVVQTSPVAAADTFFTDSIHSNLTAFFLNALPLSRQHCGFHALQELRARLVDDRLCLILFPEGTRSRTGTPARFKHGIGILVAGTTVPVVPCWIEGAFESWPPDRSRPKTGHIQVFIGEPVSFEHISNDRQGWTRIASELEMKVAELAPSRCKRELNHPDTPPLRQSSR